jgi:SAM-dependent methyltransferase
MAEAPTANADQINYWNAVAPATWTVFQTRLDALFEPLTRLAVDAAAPAAGETAIDIGCGCGATVLELAERVGPTGHVLGLDVSEPMAAKARERIATQRLSQAEIVVSDASAYGFEPATADLLFSRFGVMFFDDPTGAFAQLRTALRPTGRMLFVCWRPVTDNPWFGLPLQAALPLLPPQPPSDPDAPGPFAFANPDRVRRILTDAGWRNIELQRQDAPMQLGALNIAIDFALRMGPLAAVLRQVNDDDLRSRVREVLIQALGAHAGPDGITLPGSVWLVTAKP